MSPPRVCFIGLYDRALDQADARGATWRKNIIGLSRDVKSFVYPLLLQQFGLAVAVYEPRSGETIKLRFCERISREVIDLTLQTQCMMSDASGPREVPSIDGWLLVTESLPASAVHKPGEYDVLLDSDVGECLLGTISFSHLAPPMLTEADINAIKSDPLAAKIARIELACRTCDSKFLAYAALERNSELEKQGWVWQYEIPETFVCHCGATKVSLEYLRKGMHGLLRRHTSLPSSLATTERLYERTALEEYCKQFKKTIDSGGKEEVLQRFIALHNVFLHRFSAQKLIPKAPILSFFHCDFAILNNRKELLLIEIERADIRLMKKLKNTFGITAALQHALTQVNSWMRVFEDHRSAALKNIGLNIDEVAKVKGVVVAGRTPGNPDEARALRALSFDDVELLTYDDLLSDAVYILRDVASL